MEDSKFIISALDEAAETIVTLQAIALELDKAATAAGLDVAVTPWNSDNVITLLEKIRTAKLLAVEDCEK